MSYFNGKVCSGRIVFTLATLVLASMILDCAPTSKRYYPAYYAFSEANKKRLHVGMTAKEAQSIFGKPDVVYDAVFGQDVGESWQGRVWLYFTRPDPSLKYVVRYEKNMLVFYPPGDHMRLNYWQIEE